MEFRTIVELPSQGFTLTPASRVMLLGSCFAEEIGEHLRQSLPEGNVDVNPFGVLYNPESIALSLNTLLANDDTLDVFCGQDGIWHSWQHSGKFSATTREECERLCRERLASAREMLRTADVLVITLGTDRCYRLKDTGACVANCHKELATTFTEDTASSEALRRAISAVQEAFPSLHILLTVSPYRYKKYGFHASQLAKARLLLLCEELQKEGERVSYFPAYEILLDELRDYRFFATDMLHPSQQAVDYIWERFSAWCFSEELTAFAQEQLRILKRNAHRPLH